MSTEGERDIPMEPGMVLDYVCSTKGYPMAGIQVGICKYGKELSGGALLCSVYDEKKEQLLSQTLVSVGELDDGQYVYIPFENSELCDGTIAIEFTYSSADGQAAGLLVNTKALDDAKTFVNGQESEFMLKSYYIYKVAYYPLLFDLCVLLFMFTGVFFLGEKSHKMKKNLEGNEVAAHE